MSIKQRLSGPQEAGRFDQLFAGAISRLQDEYQSYADSGYAITSYLTPEDKDTLFEVFTLYRTTNSVGVHAALISHSDIVALAAYTVARMEHAKQQAEAELRRVAANLAIAIRSNFIGFVKQRYTELVAAGDIAASQSLRFDAVKQTDATVTSLVHGDRGYQAAESLHGVIEQFASLAQTLFNRIEQRRDCLVQLSVHERDKRN